MKKLIKPIVGFLIFWMANSCQAQENDPSPNPFSLGRIGDSKDTAVSTEAGLVLMGGGTETEKAIQYLIHEKKVPIGGTSAGCAIMGTFVYTGENGSIVSTEALSNPFDSRLTVRKSTLINHPFLQNLITDQHFTERGREGRLVSFLARLKSQSQTIGLRGIAVDERTALCVDRNGDAIVLGTGSVTIIEEHQPQRLPERLQAGQSLHWRFDEQVLRYRRLTHATNQESVNIFLWDIPWTNQFWFVDNGQLRLK